MHIRALILTVITAGAGLAQPSRAPLNVLSNALARGTFNVRNYGAKGDGKTDDQQAIMGAVSAATAHRGGVIYFPAGKYLHSGILDFGSGMVVSGADQSSLVVGTNHSNAALRFVGAAGCGVFNVALSSDAVSREGNYESADIYLEGASDCAISAVSIDGSASAGMVIHNSANIVVTSNQVRNTMADGIHTVGGSHNVLVAGNQAWNTGDDSFSAVAYAPEPQTANVTIMNNVSVRSHARGVSCVGAINCLIQGNQVYSPAAHGIAVVYESSWNTWAPSGTAISGNVIVSAAQPGFMSLLVEGASNVKIDANDIYDSTPVYLHSSQNVTVQGLRVHHALDIGILGRDCTGLALRAVEIDTAAESGILLERVPGAEISNATLANVQTTGDPVRGAIDAWSCARLSGGGNVVQHGRNWQGKSFGPVRTPDCPAVALNVATLF
jgi:hypothetical protein